jgi:hypothetical protein
MPDFDKNLAGTQVDASVNLEDSFSRYPQPVAPLPGVSSLSPGPLGTPGLDSVATDFTSYMDIESKKAMNINERGVSVSLQTLEDNKRFKTFNPLIDNYEDFAAQGQSTTEKVYNGLIKFAGTTATTLVSGTIGTIYGGLSVAETGKFSSFYDNDLSRALDDISNKLEDNYGHYKTLRQQNASWYEPENLLSANFLMDGIVKNLGFSLGAAAAGFAWGGAFKAIGLTSRLMAYGEEGAIAADKIIAEGAMKGVGSLGKTNVILDGALTQGKKLGREFLSKADQHIVNVFATSTEAGIEALHNSQEYRKKAIEEFKSKNFRDPNLSELNEINASAENVGLWSFWANAAILGVSNNVQLPKIYSSSFKSEKTQLNRIALEETGDVVSTLPKSGLAKFAYKGRNLLSLGLNTSEGIEEGLQFAVQTGTQNYFDLKQKGKKDLSILDDGVLYGLKQALTTEEGTLNIFTGAFSGGLQSSGIIGIKDNRLVFGQTGKIGRRGFTGYGGTEGALRNEAIEAFNKTKLKDKLVDIYSNIKAAEGIQQERERALEQGDILTSKDLEFDYAHTYVSTRVKYGAKEFIDQEIENLKRQARTPGGFEQLKSEGRTAELDTVETFTKRLDNLQEHANVVDKQYESVNRLYSGQKNEDGSRKYPDIVIDKLVYHAAKIYNYNKRIPEVIQSLNEVDVDILNLLDQVRRTGKVKEEDSAKAVAAITSMDAVQDEQNRLLTDLNDALELTLLKKEHVDAYNSIIKNPVLAVPKLETTTVINENGDAVIVDENGNTVLDADGNPVVKETIRIKTKKGERNLIIGEEYYLGRTVQLSKEGYEIYRFPKLTILGKNEDGTIRIKDKNGERDVPEDVLEDYNLGLVFSTNSDRKAKFYMDNINTPFTFNFGKGKGGKVPGRLQYNPEEGILDFVYKTKSGKIKIIEVTREQFKAKKGFKEAMVMPMAPLTLAKQKQLDSFTEDTATDPRISQKNEKRLSILMKLYDDIINKKEKFSKQIEAKQATIAAIKVELSELNDVIANTPVDKRSTTTVKFKAATRKAMQAAIKLSNTQRVLEQEIELLETEQEELSVALVQVESLADSLDQLPTNTEDFLKELKDEIKDLEELHASNGKIMNDLAKLVAATERAIQSAIDLLSSMISSFEKKYPNVPRVMGQDWVDFIALNPNFLKLKPNYKEELQVIDESIANIDEETIKPSESRLNNLQEHLSIVSNELGELEKLIKAKGIIAYRFKSIMSKYEDSLAEKEVSKTKGESSDILSSTLDTSVQTTEAYEENEDFEEASKKPDEYIPTSTVPSTDAIKHKNPSALRALRFGNRFLKLSADKKFKVRIVTFNTEPKIANGALTGMFERLFPGSAVDEKQDMIALLVTDEAGNPVDEFGDSIAENSKDAVDRAIYQVMPSKELKQFYTKEGKKVYETMFRQTTSAEDVARITATYEAWRAAMKSSEEIIPLQEMTVSFGFPTKPEDPDARTDVQAAGLLDVSTLLDTNVINIATIGNTVENGSFSLKTALGMVYLNLPNTLVKLYNRTFSPNEAQTIYSAIERLATLAETPAKLRDPEAKSLYTWLKSTIYWGIAHEGQTGKRKDPPNKSNIWFENHPTTGEPTLFMGEDSFPFTKSALELNKQIIISKLLGLYGNTNAVLAAKPLSNSYVEIIGFKEGVAVTRRWPNYQSYLLSNKLPDEDGLLTITRPVEDIPLKTKFNPLKGKDDYNREGIYFTALSSVDQYTKPVEEVKAEEIPKTTPTGAQTKSTGLALDGVTTNNLPIGTFGSVNFRVNKEDAIPVLATYGTTILDKENAGDLVTLVGELIDKNILVFDPIDNGTLAAVVDQGMATDDTVKFLLEMTAAKQVIKALIPLLVVEQVTKEVTTTPEVVPAPAAPVLTSEVKNPIYVLDGTTENSIEFMGINIPFTINGSPIMTLLGEDPQAFDTNEKIFNKAFEYLQNKILVPDYTDAVIEQFERKNAALKAAGSPEISASDLNQLLSYTILAKVVEYIQSNQTSVEQTPTITEAVVEDPVVTETAEEPTVIPPTVSIITGNGAPRRRRSAFRTAVDAQVSQFDGEVWDKLAPELEKMLPQVPVFRVKNIIQATNGRQAWGMFRDGAIYVYKNAEAGTAYHEVFEAIWGMFTDVEERKALIAEFKSRPGSFKEHGSMESVAYKDATDHQAKEEMAEEFRRYILDKKAVKEKSFLRRLFDNMIAFFEELLFGPTAVSNTEALFKRIGNGYYVKYNQYAPVLAKAKQGIIDIDSVVATEDDEYRIAGLSAKEEHELFQHMTFTAISSLIQEGKSFFTITKKLSGAEMYDTIYKEILGDSATNTPGIIDDMFLDVVKSGASKAYIDKRSQEILVLKQRVQEAWPQLVKQHKKYLMAYSITFDEYDNIVLEDENSSKQEYGESNKVDSFKKASAAVKMLFATIPDSEIINNELDYIPSSINGVTFMGTDKVYINLMNALHDSTDITQMLVNLEKMALDNHNYATVYRRLTKQLPGKGIPFDKSNMSADDLRLLTAFWNVVNKQNPDVFTIISRSAGDTSVSNTNLTDAARQNRDLFTNAIVKTIKEESTKYFSYNKKTKSYSPTSLLLNLELDTKSAESAAVFLKNLGIEIDGAIIESWKNGTKNKMRTNFINSTKGLLTSLKSMKDVVYLSGNTINAAGNLLGIGATAAMIKTPNFETVYYNLDREKVQSFIGPNFSSSFYSVFSKAQNLSDLGSTQFSYLLTDVFSKNSVILKKVFNPMSGKRGESTDNIMKVNYTNGTIEDELNERTATSSLDYSGRLAQEINLNLDGVYLNLVPGDAELEWGLRLHEKDSPFVSDEDIQTKTYQRIFRGYFIDELNLAREKRIVPGKNEEARKERSKSLRFFKEIFGDTLHKRIIEEKGNLSAEQVYSKYENEIKNAVETYVNNNARETKDLLLSYSLIRREEDGYSTTLGFDTSELSQETMDLEIKKLTLNYIIANTEMHKLLYSDPYQYEDELKRIKNYNSPRRMLADSYEINLAIHNTYNKGYSPTDKGYFKMDKDHLRTVVFEEINATQDVNGLPEYQIDWKEGDGGGLIIDKARRLIAIKDSDWNENEEAQYKHDVIYEEIVDQIEAAETEEERIVLTEKLEEHEKLNPGVNSAYRPTKPIVAGSKANGRDYNDQILDKYALFTMSFRLMHKINPNSDAIKLYRKMIKENIDYGVFPSARKVGREIVHPLYDEEGNFSNVPFQTEEQRMLELNNELAYDKPRTVTNVPFKIMGIQTDVPSKEKFTGSQASQITKLVTMDFRQGGVPIDYIPKGKDSSANFDDVFISWMKLSEKEKLEQSTLYKEITHNNEILVARVKKGYKEVLDLLGIKEIDGGYELVDREKLVSTLESEILKQEVNNNILDALESFRKEGTTVILEATPAYQQVRYILYALSNSRVKKPKITGGQKVQAFSSLLLSSGRKIKEATSKGKKFFVSDDLKFYTKGENGAKTNVAEIMISRWFDSPLSDKELLDYLNNTPEGQDVLKGIGFRIPTQKQNSIEAFVIKEFLPKEYGDTVILPSEIVQKAGSDFDIDKLTMYLKTVFINRKGQPQLIKFLDEKTTVAQRYITWVNEEATKDVKKYISFLSKDEVKNIRDRFNTIFKTINKEASLAIDTKFSDSYNMFSDSLENETNNIYEQQDILMKNMFAAGSILYRKLSPETKELFSSVKETMLKDDVKGPEEIRRYLDLSLGLINATDKSVTDLRDTPTLEKMVELYKMELETLGEAKAAIANTIKAHLDVFRGDKANILATVNALTLNRQAETKTNYDEQIGELSLIKAKEIASIAGLPSIEEFSNFSIYEQNIRPALDNEYISSLERLVTHPSNFENLVKPNSADQLKNLTKEINELLNIPEIVYDSPAFMLSRKNMSGLRNAFVTGKRAIGIAAVGQTNNANNQGFMSVLDTDKLTMDNFTATELALLGDGEIKFSNTSYNSVTIEGRTYPTLSKVKNAAGEYISDIIGMFIDGYVDISKGPWIMELGAVPKVAGTWLFLIKIGVPIDTLAYFMNQPAIRELIKQSQITGVSLNNTDLFDEVVSVYGDVDENSVEVIPNNESLKEMIKGRPSAFNQTQRSQQVFMLKEFLKYNSMAGQLFEAVEATNIDTANINDPFLMFKKQTQLDKARKNMVLSVGMKDGVIVKQSAADAILDTTFIGELNGSMHKIRDAHSLVLLSDKPRLREIFENILFQYVDANDKQFVRISRGLVSDLFDWAVSTDRKFSNTVRKVMLGTEDSLSAAEEIIEFRDSVFGNAKKNIPPDPKHPLYGNFALEAMSLVPGGNDSVANNIQIIGRDNKIYDTNRLINSFDEIKEYFKNQNNIAFYGKIVRLAIMQSGMSFSKISFTNLLPYDDFREIYDKTLSNLENLDNLDNFQKLNVYQRINANNPDIVQPVGMKREFDPFSMTYTPSRYEKQVPRVLKEAMAANQIPKVIVRAGGADIIKLSWTEEITKEERKIRAKTGDTSHFKTMLMRKVYRDENKTIPLIHEIPLKGKPSMKRYVYVAINAWGNSFKSKEFYDPITVNNNGVPVETIPASIFDNGFEKVQLTLSGLGNKGSAPEVEDSVIVELLDKTNVSSPTAPSLSNVRKIQVDQFDISIRANGKMYYSNGNEVTDKVTQNKVNIRKELQDGTLRTSIYNKSNYFVLLDDTIVGSGKTNLGKETITDPNIRKAILAKAVTYKKQC